VPAPGQSGPGGHRLSAADDLRRRAWPLQRKPPAGGVRHLPDAENHGQGAAGARTLPEPAVPRQRKARRQAAHAVRPAGIRRHRTGRRHCDVSVPGRLL